MDRFQEIWTGIKDKYLDEENDSVVQDYKRAAVAFCWCDKERNFFHADLAKVWEVVQTLRELPATLTARMFVVCNGANAFVSIDDDTKKKSKVTTNEQSNAAGSGEPA